MTAQVRPIQRRDVPRVVEMWSALMANGHRMDPRWRPSAGGPRIMERWAPDTWLLVDPFVHAWVAEADDGLVGFLDGQETNLSPVLEQEPMVTIGNLWVEPEWRRHGLGRSLVAAFTEGAREAGLLEVEVGTLTLDHRAVAFWAALGFGPWRVTLRQPLLPG